MKDILALVQQFHESFEVPVRKVPTASIEEAEMRFEIMREENEEYREAIAQNDLVAIADALADQLYVLCGTILAHGLQDKIVEVLHEIHRSNMSKLDANGRPIRRADGKVLKSDSYFRPNLGPILSDSI